MSILVPTTGQLLDRLEVLRLKLEMARQRGRSVAHFHRECLAVEEEVARRFPRGLDALKEQRRDLELLHARLWHHQQWLQSVECADAENCLPLAQIAIDVCGLGRQRIFLIDTIDRVLNEFTGSEALEP